MAANNKKKPDPAAEVQQTAETPESGEKQALTLEDVQAAIAKMMAEAQAKADAIIADALVGFEGMDVPYVVMPNRYDAILWALQNRQQDDILLLAGKGHEDYQVLKDETIYFDEKVIVENLLSQRQ